MLSNKDLISLADMVTQDSMGALVSSTTILISTSLANNCFAVAPQIPHHTHYTYLSTTTTSSTTKSLPTLSVSSQNKTLLWLHMQNSINCHNKNISMLN